MFAPGGVGVYPFKRIIYPLSFVGDRIATVKVLVWKSYLWHNTVGGNIVSNW